jgi:peptidoglycan/LPS O-acetylase OafA/YrhL
VCFSGALVTDLAYEGSDGNRLWVNFSSWLIAAGLLAVAAGMGALLLCAMSPRLPLSRQPVPGAAFIASLAYSVYLSHKLVIHQVSAFCSGHAIDLRSWQAQLLVQVSIYLGGALLFFAVERPFLQLRRRVAPV